MHCELVVPGLFAAPGATRLPSAELLIARGRCTASDARSLEDWLHDAFELGDEALAAGALTLLGAGGEPGGDCWTRADPVHLQLMRERLVLVPAAALEITGDEAAALCAALNQHFAERLVLQAIDARRWVAKLPRDMALGREPALALAGRDVAPSLPPDAAALLNEAQMVLHSHALNEAREARGAPPINSLWLWGAGRAPRAAHAQRWHSISAADPLVLGLGRAAGLRHRPLPAGGEAWLARAPEEGRHLLVLEALRAPLALAEEESYRESLAALERDWFAPLLAALRAGRIGMVTIHVPDAGECTAYETIRGDLRRFWRRPKALEHYA
jgi:hypothetical protein